jgi:hypothetical protein
MKLQDLEIQGRLAALDAILLALVKTSPDALKVMGEATTTLTKMFDLNNEAILQIDDAAGVEKQHTLIANETLKTISLDTLHEFRKELVNES